MTILNLTITPDRITISSDSAVADPVGIPLEGGGSADPGELALAFADPDKPVYPPPATGYRQKIAILGDRRRILAGAGMVLPVVVAAGLLTMCDGTVEEQLGQLSANLVGLRKVAPAGASSGMVLVGVWEPHQGAAAYLLASGNDWRPQRLGCGHACSPMPHPKIVGHDELVARILAPPGDDVEALHLALARHQAEVATQGLYKAGPAIGGDLWLAEVDRGGGRARVIGEL